MFMQQRQMRARRSRPAIDVISSRLAAACFVTQWKLMERDRAESQSHAVTRGVLLDFDVRANRW